MGILFLCYNTMLGQDAKLFTLTANAIAIGEFSGDKPNFNQRKAVNTDIEFYDSTIKIDNKGQTTLKLRNKKDFSNDTSVAFRYDATDGEGEECVVMLEIHSDNSILNIFYEHRNIYIRYYILKSD